MEEGLRIQRVFIQDRDNYYSSIRFHLIQINHPKQIPTPEYLARNLAFIQDQKKKILSYIDKIEINNFGNIIILPELSVPNDPELVNELKKRAEKLNSVIIGGFFFDETYINRCRIFFPKGEEESQHKIFLSRYEKENAAINGAHQKLPAELKIFTNTPVGDFAVVICFDFLSKDILDKLYGKIDHLIVLSWNHATDIYETKAKVFAYDSYCHIAIVNVADEGRSGLYLPFKGNQKIF